MPPKKKAKEVAQLPEVPGPDQTVPAEQLVAGDGGAREVAVTGAIAKVFALADEINLGENAGAVVARLTDWGLELIKRRPKPWDQLSRDEQRDLQKAIAANATEVVRQTIEAVTKDGKPAIRAMLESYTDKDGIKAILKVRPSSAEEELAAVVGLHQAKGQIVLVQIASVADFAREPAPDRSQPDQPALGFDAGSDQHAEGQNDDLADAAGGAPLEESVEARPELAETGKQMLVEGYGLCEIRVSLKTGMVEAKAAQRDDFDIDVREATSVELAAERDRIADFAEVPAE